jgi:hypothetical protein
MNPSERGFQPGKLTVSKYHPYSLGVVAENKALNSDVIEVTPIEEFTMLDGELNAQTTDTTSAGQDASGQAYSTTVKTGNTIQASWMKTGIGNRKTSPDVRRGAIVMIYQFGDSDTFYWTTHKDDMALRKLETVIWGFSGTKDENAVNSAENMYYLEISTHTGLVTFHTSSANGEYCEYDVQINTKAGNLIMQDNKGNSFLLDTAQTKLRLENTDGSFLDITKQVMSAFTKDTINMETQTWNVKAKVGNLNVDTTNLTGSNFIVKETETKITSTDITTNGATVNMTSSDMKFKGGANFTGPEFVVVSPIIDLG